MERKIKRMRDLTDEEKKEFVEQVREILNTFVKQTLEPIVEGFRDLAKIVEGQAEFVAPLLQRAKMLMKRSKATRYHLKKQSKTIFPSMIFCSQNYLRNITKKRQKGKRK